MDINENKNINKIKIIKYIYLNNNFKTILI